MDIPSLPPLGEGGVTVNDGDEEVIDVEGTKEPKALSVDQAHLEAILTAQGSVHFKSLISSWQVTPNVTCQCH